MQSAFDQESHTENIAMQSVGVTRVLSHVGISPDFAGIPPLVLERARKRGISVDEACQCLDEGVPYEPADEQIAAYITTYKMFLATSAPRIIAAQPRLRHPELYYVGQPDVICMISWDRWVIDRKVTATIAPSVAIQTAAYALAWNRIWPDVPVSKRGALHLRKDGTYRLIECAANYDEQVWLAALRYYRDPGDAVAKEVIERWKAQTSGL